MAFLSPIVIIKIKAECCKYLFNIFSFKTNTFFIFVNSKTIMHYELCIMNLKKIYYVKKEK